jgi:hypothetical protein
VRLLRNILILSFLIFGLVFSGWYFYKNRNIPNSKVTESNLTTEAQIDKKIHDFLNKEGNYTEIKIKNNIIKASLGNKSNNETKLGMVDGIAESVDVEGIPLSYIEKDGNIVMVVGFDGRNGNRFVTGLEIPMAILNEYPDTNFLFSKLEKPEMLSSVGAVDTSGDEKSIKEYLDKFVSSGNPIVFSLDIIGYSKKWLDQYSGHMKDYIREERNKVSLVEKLIENLPLNNLPGVNTHWDIQTPKITSADEINNIDLLKVPFIQEIIFFN